MDRRQNTAEILSDKGMRSPMGRLPSRERKVPKLPPNWNILTYTNLETYSTLKYSRHCYRHLAFNYNCQYRAGTCSYRSRSWAYPIVRNIFKRCPRCNAMLRITLFRVIGIATRITEILLHKKRSFQRMYLETEFHENCITVPSKLQ